MKKLAVLLIFLLDILIFSYSQSVTYNFEFKEMDFPIHKFGGDSLLITSPNYIALFGANGCPSMPMVVKRIPLMHCENPIGLSYSFNKRLIKENIKLSSVQRPITTDISINDISIINTKYEEKLYPDSNCMIGAVQKIGDAKIVNIFVCPFIYDAKTKELFFTDSIEIKLLYNQNESSRSIAELNENEKEIFYDLFPDDNTIEIPVKDSWDDVFEYIIITSNELKSDYEPLVDWKRKKGVTTKIITTEDIDETYSGSSKQIRIRSAIKDYFENHQTKYVLLGGDVNIIPVQYCNVRFYEHGYTQYSDSIIPADVYYSCMNDELNWDTDGDGRYGDYTDNVDATPTMYVARALVNTAADVEVFVKRTIEYEQSPIFKTVFFQAGTKLSDPPYAVDGYDLSNIMFNNVFENKTYMDVRRLFQGHNDIDKTLSLQSFSQELKEGFQFVQVCSHGFEKSLGDGGQLTFFNIPAASSLMNSGHTLFTTTSCHTNKFDLGELSLLQKKCLSEALFTNPNSGIIGYIGSSRFGWFNGDPNLQYSIRYENEFYERLFDHSSLRPFYKSFGALVCHTKAALYALGGNIQSQDQTQRSIYKWLHYSINAIGDPETPIFYSYPKEFQNASAEYGSDGVLHVDPGVEDAKVCVSKAKTNSGFYDISNGPIYNFDTGYGTFDVWITKQNYKPKHMVVTKKRELNENPDTISFDDGEKELSRIISISPNPATTNVEIKYYVASHDPSLQVVFTNITTGRQYIYDITHCFSQAIIDVTNMVNGLYAVTLIENGNVITCNEKFIKQ